MNDYYLTEMYTQLNAVMETRPGERLACWYRSTNLATHSSSVVVGNRLPSDHSQLIAVSRPLIPPPNPPPPPLPQTAQDEDYEDPASNPVYWISKWVDYSDKYGLGYQLCDNSVGVLFNDTTRLLLTNNGELVAIHSPPNHGVHSPSTPCLLPASDPAATQPPPHHR